MKLNTTYIIIAILGAGLIVGGSIFGSNYLDYKTKQDLIKIDKEKEERELVTRQKCQTEATKSAIDLLKDKAELSRKIGSPNLDWEELVKKGDMYLNTDYDSYLGDCLKKYGLY